MLLKDLRKAIQEGKLVDITGVNLRLDNIWRIDNQLPSVLNIRFDMPSVENKPVDDNLDITEVSLSSKPKYDPCRPYCEGDEVKIVMNKGRHFDSDAERMYLCKGIVTSDEVRGDYINVRVTFGNSEEDIEIDQAYLELVTPVEELEPFYVSTNIDCSTCTIFRRMGAKKLVYSSYYFVHGEGCSNAVLGITEAKAAAEDACASLNAEWKKAHRHE